MARSRRTTRCGFPAGRDGRDLSASLGCDPRDLGPVFESAEHEVGILAYSALFLSEDADIMAILAQRGRGGVTVRISLGDPGSEHVVQRGHEEGIGDAMPAKVRNALTLLSPLTISNGGGYRRV